MSRKRVRRERRERKLSPYKKAYNDYLASKHWQDLRKQVLGREGCCQARRKEECAGSLHVHHRVYRTPLTMCIPSDLMVLCELHHHLVHRLVARKRLSLDVATDGVVNGEFVDLEITAQKYVIVPPRRRKPTKKKRGTQPGRRCSSCFNTYDRSYPFVRCECGRLLPTQQLHYTA